MKFLLVICSSDLGKECRISIDYFKRSHLEIVIVKIKGKCYNYIPKLAIRPHHKITILFQLDGLDITQNQ